MYLFTVSAYLLIFKAVISHGSIQKCCGFGEYLHVANGTHQCIQDTTKRLGIITDTVNYIKTHLDGECVDFTTDNFSKFLISNGNVVHQTRSEEEVFGKCCPLGYKYNSQRHACNEDPNSDQTFITRNFVRVGLPHCKLIIDKKEDSPEGSHEFCIDRDESGDLIRRECRETTEDCDNVRCVKKCCPDGQSFVNGATCTNTYVHGLNLSFSKNVEEPSCKLFFIFLKSFQRIYSILILL